jgi:hypothetical protein
MSAIAACKNRGDQDNWIVGSVLWIMGKHIRIILRRCGFWASKSPVMHVMLHYINQPMKYIGTHTIHCWPLYRSCAFWFRISSFTALSKLPTVWVITLSSLSAARKDLLFVSYMVLKLHQQTRNMYTSQIYLQSQLRILVVIFILSVHNMFRPLRAILRWNTTTSFIYLESAMDTTTDPLFYNCSFMWCKFL